MAQNPDYDYHLGGMTAEEATFARGILDSHRIFYVTDIAFKSVNDREEAIEALRSKMPAVFGNKWPEPAKPDGLATTNS